MDQYPTLKECFNCIDNWYYQYCNRKFDIDSYGEHYKDIVAQLKPCPVEWFTNEIERDKRNIRKVLKRVPFIRAKFIDDVINSTWDRDEQQKLEHFCLSAGFYFKYGYNRKQFNRYRCLVKRYNITKDETIFWPKVYFKKNGKFDRKRTGFDL